jgi:hypothetical protein
MPSLMTPAPSMRRRSSASTAGTTRALGPPRYELLMYTLMYRRLPPTTSHDYITENNWFRPRARSTFSGRCGRGVVQQRAPVHHPGQLPRSMRCGSKS